MFCSNRTSYSSSFQHETVARQTVGTAGRDMPGNGRYLKNPSSSISSANTSVTSQQNKSPPDQRQHSHIVPVVRAKYVNGGSSADTEACPRQWKRCGHLLQCRSNIVRGEWCQELPIEVILDRSSRRRGYARAATPAECSESKIRRKVLAADEFPARNLITTK